MSKDKEGRSMNSDMNFLADGIARAQNLTDEQKEAVKNKFNELNEESSTPEAPTRFPDPTKQINESIFRIQKNSSTIIKKYVIGSGANIVYCLSVIAIIYGISGIFEPIWEKRDTLFDKFMCTSAMALYEIALFAVISLLVILRKSIDDAVSLMIYVAMFIVGTGIGVDSISNDGKEVSLVAALAFMLLSGAKIFLMRQKLLFDFSRYLVAGTMIVLVWNFFMSPVMAFIISDDPAIKDILRNVWLGGWLVLLAGGVAMFAGAMATPSGESLGKDKDRQFLFSRGMAWLFSLVLFLGAVVHQTTVAYVFEFKYAAGDFIPVIILFALLQIELLRNYGKKAGVTEVLVSLVPLAAIGILVLNGKFLAGSLLGPAFFWNPAVLFLIAGASLAYVFWKNGDYNYIYLAVPYVLGAILTAGITVHVPADLNWKLFGALLTAAVLFSGIYFRSIILCVIGSTLLAIGVGVWNPSHEALTGIGFSFPSTVFLLWGVSMIIISMFFNDRFPAIVAFCAASVAMIASFAAAGSTAYVLISSAVFLGLAIAYMIRCGIIPVAVLLGIPVLHGIFLLLKEFNYWHYVILSFVLLGVGAVISVLSKPRKEKPAPEKADPAKPAQTSIFSKNLNVWEVLLFVFLFFVFVGMFMPPVNCSREKARRISCTSNLKQIGLAIRMYSQENKECFPPYDGARGLEMLRSGGYLENVRMYTCPSTTDTIPDNNEITDDNCSYGYRGGLNESTSIDTAVVWDKPHNHKKYGNVLFCDGHASGFAGTNWRENIK